MSTSYANRVAQSLAVVAALLPAVAQPTALAASAVPPIPRPATVLSVSPTRTDLHVEARGQVCGSNGNTCHRILYRPMNDPSGVAALQRALEATSPDEQIIVFGYSEGATVVAKWVAEHADDPDAPPPSQMSIVVIGNPTRAGGGITVMNGVTWPQGPYQVIDVARQYDGVADYPNNPKSPYYWLAVVNAARGTLIGGGLHNYAGVDIYAPENAVWTSEDGKITYVLVPTQYVPILGGLGKMFPEWNEEMKAKIETAYIRPVPFPTPAPPAVTALQTPALPQSTVTPEHTATPVSLAPPVTAGSTDAVSASTHGDGTDNPETPPADEITPKPTLPDADTDADVEPATPPESQPDAGDTDTSSADDTATAPTPSDAGDAPRTKPAVTPSTGTHRSPSLLRRIQTAMTRPDRSATADRADTGNGRQGGKHRR